MDHCSPFSALLFQRSLSCLFGSCVSCSRGISRQDICHKPRTQGTTLAPNGWALCSSSYQRAQVFLKELIHCLLPSGGDMTPPVMSLRSCFWPVTAWQSYASVAVEGGLSSRPCLFGTIERRLKPRSALVSKKGGAKRGVSWATSGAAGYHTGSYVGVAGGLRIDHQGCLEPHHAVGAAVRGRNGAGTGRDGLPVTTFNASWI